jgi:UPF0755 protein
MSENQNTNSNQTMNNSSEQENRLEDLSFSSNKQQENMTAEDSSNEAVSEEKKKFVINISEEDYQIGDDLQDVPSDSTYSSASQSTDSQDKPAKRKKKKKKVVKEKIGPVRMTFKILLAVIIIGIAVGIAGVIVWAAKDVMGFGDHEDAVTISIEPNATITDVANQMEEAGVIQSAFVFRAYVKYATEGIVINYGNYDMYKAMPYADIISTLEEYADTTNVSEKVTIPEGYTVEQIAETLQGKRICTAEAFINEVNNGTFEYDFIQELSADPDIANRPYRLEGYLFPDTYTFALNADPHEVVDRFLKNFDKKFDSDMRAAVKKKGYTVDQIVNFASIVQAEAPVAEEMANVSSVYWNRLNNPSEFPKLQADPTTRYAENVLKPLNVDQSILDAYNTYRCEGLPMGAINNPGLEALTAALNPSNTSYYFFVTSSDMKTFLYAETYEEHQKNCEQVGLDG